MAIASTPCSPLPATTSALGYNEDRRQLQLMDGWQASEAWRANLRAEYILSEARAVAGGVAAWVARKIVTNGARTAVQRFSFPKFFPKKFGQKIGAVLQWRISGTTRVRVLVLLHPAPLSCR
jgi:hypothetical protein